MIVDWLFAGKDHFSYYNHRFEDPEAPLEAFILGVQGLMGTPLGTPLGPDMDLSRFRMILGHTLEIVWTQFRDLGCENRRCD